MGRVDTGSKCQEAMIYYFDYLSEQRDFVPAAICEHIEKCEHCQRELRWLGDLDISKDTLTQTVTTADDIQTLELHYSLIGHPISCSITKPFLPVLAIPGQEVTVPTPVTVHIDRCRRCAEDLQTLKNLNLTATQYGLVCTIFTKHAIDFPDHFSPWQLEAVGDILYRPDSGVVTCFRLKEDSKIGKGEVFEVEVLSDQGFEDTEQEQVQAVFVQKPRLSHPHSLKRFLGGLTAAAAVLLVGFFLFFNSASLQATDISQIYEALKNVNNICMTHYDVLRSEPIQQIWVSRSLGIKFFKTGQTYSLWDIKNKTQKTLESSSDGVESIPLDRTMIKAVSETMNVPYDLLPFKRSSELPAGAVWEKVRPAQPAVTDDGSAEVYNLIWTEETTNGREVRYRWQCRIDPVNKHPQKVLLWRKDPAQQDYELTSEIKISYPNETQIQTIIQQAGF